MGIKIKILIFKTPTEESAFAIKFETLFFFVLKGFWLVLDCHKEFHACCRGTLSHSNETFLAGNCQIRVIFKVFLHFYGSIFCYNDPNLAAPSQKGSHLGDSEWRGVHEIFSQLKTKQKPFRTKKNSV